MRWFPQTFRAVWPLFAILSSGPLFSEPLRAQTKTAEQAAAEAGNEAAVPITAYRTQVELVEKFSKVFETKNFIKQVNSFDPVVVEVTPLSPNRINVRGLLQGVTSLVITDASGTNYTVEVLVKGDARTLQTIIDRKFPNSSIEAFKVQEAVALRGWVTHPEHITQIVEIAEQFYPKVLNQMRVSGVQQVLLKVKVMEAQRSVLRELGMNLTYLNRNGYAFTNPGLIAANAATVPLGGPAAVATTANGLLTTASFGLVGDNNSFQAFLAALRNESLLKILAEPEVVATNGRPATMLSGGEFPILVPQSLGTNTIMWREFGVRLEAVPVVLGGGNLRLELQPEVSDRDFTNAVNTGGIVVPGLTVRRVNTQVEMKFGQTLMLAGLISARQAATTHKIPFLGELPYIGTAFSRKRYEDSETEVVITVTPELVAPLDEGQVPAGGPGRFTDAPTDRELMAYGLVEVPKLGDRCATCGPAPAGPYIVPGLKEMSAPAAAPPAGGSAGNLKELVTPPAPPAPVDAETSARAKRFAAQMAARQKAQSSGPGVRQTGYDEDAVRARATESTRSPAPTTGNRTASTAKTAAPTRSSAAPTASRSGQSYGSPSATTDTNTTRNQKPGLIAPPAR